MKIEENTKWGGFQGPTNLIAFRVTDDDRQALVEAANLYTRGNISTLVRFAVRHWLGAIPTPVENVTPATGGTSI